MSNTLILQVWGLQFQSWESMSYRPLFVCLFKVKRNNNLSTRVLIHSVNWVSEYRDYNWFPSLIPGDWCRGLTVADKSPLCKKIDHSWKEKVIWSIVIVIEKCMKLCVCLCSTNTFEKVISNFCAVVCKCEYVWIWAWRMHNTNILETERSYRTLNIFDREESGNILSCNPDTKSRAGEIWAAGLLSVYSSTLWTSSLTDWSGLDWVSCVWTWCVFESSIEALFNYQLPTHTVEHITFKRT